jgi:hypothetical protein
VTATGKPPQHIPTTSECDACHSTLDWGLVNFTHEGVVDGCFSCHNGVTAEGKNAQHLPSDNYCEECHTTQIWTPATYNHINATGPCSSCHDGQTATGQPVDTHFVTSLECGYCHTSTIVWENVSYFHQSSNYSGDHGVGLLCTDCHTSNTETVNWLDNPAFQPDCAACHSNDYQQSSHPDGAGGFNTVNDLTDCSGACHEPAGHHLVSDPSWAK